MYQLKRPTHFIDFYAWKLSSVVMKLFTKRSKKKTTFQTCTSELQASANVIAPD